MNSKEYHKKIIKKDIILQIFEQCFEYDKNADFTCVNVYKLEKVLKKLVKQGKLLN